VYGTTLSHWGVRNLKELPFNRIEKNLVDEDKRGMVGNQIIGLTLPCFTCLKTGYRLSVVFIVIFFVSLGWRFYKILKM
jgi:hypothetical protein